MKLVCAKCGAEFNIESEDFGFDVSCPQCGVWLSTDRGYMSWETVISDDQDQG